MTSGSVLGELKILENDLAKAQGRIEELVKYLPKEFQNGTFEGRLLKAREFISEASVRLIDAQHILVRRVSEEV